MDYVQHYVCSDDLYGLPLARMRAERNVDGFGKESRERRETTRHETPTRSPGHVGLPAALRLALEAANARIM